MPDPLHPLTAFLAELKRRRVYRVGAAYVAVGFLLLEGLDLLVEPLGLPPVVMTSLVVIILLGFPLALVLAWAYDATPEGVRRTPPATSPSAGFGRDAAVWKPARGGAWILLGLGIGAATGAGWWLLGANAGGEIDVSEIRSIAVLPLANLSNDKAQAPFVAGMHDELINQLSQVGALLVKSRTSVMRYAGDDLTSIPEIGRALDVDAVVEGSVLRAGEKVRITVQLIHVSTDTHLWSRSFEREVRDILALHSDVARAVAEEVHAVLTPAERQRLARAREVDPEALEHYVRGRYLWNQRTPAALAEALEEFRAALDIDPSYAQAWAGIADAYVVPSGHGLAEDATARGVAAARRALALDSTLAEAHTALAYGLVAEWEWQESERHFRRAIDMNPSYATAHQWYAELLVAQNRMDQAVASARRATVRDPLSGIISWNLARTLYFARRPAEAIEQLRRLARSDSPDLVIAVPAFVLIGQPDSAWDRLLTGGPPPDLIRELRDEGLSPIQALFGAWEEAPAPELPPVPAALRHVIRVQAAVVSGREAEALERLEAAGPGKIGGFVVDLVADPLLDPIRDTPGYRNFLRRVGVARYWPANGAR